MLPLVVIESSLTVRAKQKVAECSLEANDYGRRSIASGVVRCCCIKFICVPVGICFVA